MKKIMTILLVVVLVLACTLSVSAAGAINADEQRVLDELSKTVEFNGVKYFIPKNYINQARNYFLTDACDMTPAQADEIIKQINNGIDVVTHAEEAVSGGTFHLENLSAAHKEQLLDAGEKACEVIDLTFTYDATQKDVIIKNSENQTVFKDDPIIKTTGAEVNYTAIVVTVSALVVTLVAAYAISKKAKLF